MSGSMETLPGRSKDQVQNLDGPQKLGILHDEPEVEQAASKIGVIPIEIRLHIKTHPRK